VDQGSLGLVVGLLNDRIGAVRRVQPRIEGGRGQQLLALVESMLVGVERERDRLLKELAAATDDDEAAVLGRMLLRLLSQVRGFSMLTPYLADVGRVDLPMGLVQSIEILIESLLPEGADPVVHLDEHHMYSTLDLLSLTESVRVALGVTGEPTPAPIVFFLPGTDPNNALLLPILGHEVGHPAVDQARLMPTVLDRASLDALNTLLDDCMNAAGETDATPWQIRLFHWLEELMCDALATVLTGPSFLFASAVFLPAPDEGVLGTHPFPSDRIGMTLRLLDALGWRNLLTVHAPGITAWLEGLDQPIGAAAPRERFLREGVRLLEPALFEVAREHVSGDLEPNEFDNIQSFLAELLHAGVPPAEISGKAVPPWAAVLAAWLHRVREHGDVPATLIAAVADREFNASILKAIEMSRILSLWGAP
jgi:hypothetical protein